METCPCGSELTYEECCGPLLTGTRAASTAEALLRSRFTAYTRKDSDYIYNTTHPDKIGDHDKASIEEWAGRTTWHKLEIIEAQGGQDGDEEGTIEFVADYSEKGARIKHHETASFKKKDGAWYFHDGTAVAPKQYIRPNPKVGRNKPCPCGSGKKYKKCCGKG